MKQTTGPGLNTRVGDIMSRLKWTETPFLTQDVSKEKTPSGRFWSSRRCRSTLRKRECRKRCSVIVNDQATGFTPQHSNIHRVKSMALLSLKKIFTSLLKNDGFRLHFRSTRTTWRLSPPSRWRCVPVVADLLWETRMWIFRHRFNTLDGDKAANRRDGAVRFFFVCFCWLMSVAITCLFYDTCVNSGSGIPEAHCSPYVRASRSSIGARATRVSTSKRLTWSVHSRTSVLTLSICDFSACSLRQTGSHASLHIVETTFCPGLRALPGLLWSLRLRWNRRYWEMSSRIFDKRQRESNSAHVAMCFDLKRHIKC